MPVCAACMLVAGPTLTKNYREIPITEQVEVVSLLGDVLRITCINALHESPHGVILLDVLLDHAAFPTASIKPGRGNTISARPYRGRQWRP
jgi:hypothetical protein